MRNFQIRTPKFINFSVKGNIRYADNGFSNTKSYLLQAAFEPVSFKWTKKKQPTVFAVGCT
jgi:hypothetical protein